ncbi:MAG: metallophosphoesterase [Eubacterium sp.]|nr:metallophosphoesterase [Eubacterium sp.]
MKFYLIAIILLILISLFLYFQNNKIDITKYSIKSEKVNNSIIIAHLSDMHSKPFKKVVKKLSEIKPDIICITGDYINDHAKNKEKMFDLASEMVEFAPVYYITGNHERRLDNFEEIMQSLRESGFNVLLDEVATAEIKDSEIDILGLDENMADHKDYRARKAGIFEYRDMKPYFEELNKANGFKIVLSHCPENFEGLKEMNYSQYDFDIQLSGHAHGGQFILPFIGPVFAPGQGLFPKYARGSFGERPKLIISRGLGNSEFPFRLFNHPEINVIRINNK